MESDHRAVREAVLRAALRLFGEKGFDTCSLQEIAASAGVTKPMVHYYFESKAGLLRAVIQSVLADLLDRYRTVAADESRSVRERVELLAREQRQRREAQPLAARFLRRLLFTDPPRGLRPVDRKQMKQTLTALYDSFLVMAGQGVRSGELRGEPRIIAALLHAVFAYTPMVELLFDDEPRGTSGRWTEDMIASLWAGLVAPPGDSAARGEAQS